jgi:hypothetical protein
MFNQNKRQFEALSHNPIEAIKICKVSPNFFEKTIKRSRSIVNYPVNDSISQVFIEENNSNKKNKCNESLNETLNESLDNSLDDSLNNLKIQDNSIYTNYLDKIVILLENINSRIEKCEQNINNILEIQNNIILEKKKRKKYEDDMIKSYTS